MPPGVDASTSTWTGAQYAIPNHLDTLGGDEYGEYSLKISGVPQSTGTFAFTPTDATGEYFIYFKISSGHGDTTFYVGDLGVTPLSAGSAASVLGADGNVNLAGIVTRCWFLRKSDR